MGRIMTETEMLLGFDKAIKEGHIFPYFQPQYNHSTGRMIGAEALMRWNDPAHGMQSPADFIPVLENYRLIRKADLFMMKTICRFLNGCIESGISPVPISFNISRHDIFSGDYVNEIEEIREHYGVPVKYLRAEITESSAIGGMELVSGVLTKLHDLGYLVEMDDFGSGYSSLNVLKDLPVDVIKLDMRFLSGDLTGRGGIIVGSMVQMAKWLGASTIAEGVETNEQADYMKSIGCNYIQGYLYSRPIPQDEFLEKLKTSSLESTKPSMKLISIMDTGKFWSPESLETLIFSNYVGAACIFSYYIDTGKVDIVRANPKYMKELGMNMTEDEVLRSDPWLEHDSESRAEMESAIKKAIETGEEVEVETWRTIRSKCCGEDHICVRSSMRLIGISDDQAMIYARARNITAEKASIRALAESEKVFRYAAEHTNSYAWEYDISTDEMRPCSRCMRDLGLPPLLKNYPEPVIESGLFPADYADMYREWHRKLKEGVGELEADIPLTADRIPFRVRYTTEFDENGRPLKAYGSAELIK
ncbi:MAG: EAL domain-containing protein [Clostridia bacterium]|nr:EAL domain-containing protein [Clostridia bacterium]